MCFFLNFFKTDTEQLLICNVRSAGTKRILFVIGSLCIFFVLVLFFVLENDQIIEISQQERLKRSTDQKIRINNGDNLNHVRKFNIDEYDESVPRQKRSIAHNVDPPQISVRAENVRTKRLAENFQNLKKEYKWCKRTAANKHECQKYYDKMVKIRESIAHEINTIDDTNQNFPHIQSSNIESELPLSPPWSDSSVGQPLNEVNQEEKKPHHAKSFTHFPRVHEELHFDKSRNNLWSTVDNTPNAEGAMPRPPEPRRVLTPNFQRSQLQSSFRDNEKVIPLKNQNLGKFTFFVEFFLNR